MEKTKIKIIKNFLWFSFLEKIFANKKLIILPQWIILPSWCAAIKVLLFGTLDLRMETSW
jgi:hypothetical protein